MSVSEVNNQSTGIMIPAIATAAGATAGATVMAPAKYKSFEQLVNAAIDEVKFTEATKDLKEEAKKSAETVKKALTDAQAQIAKLNKEGLFTEGKAEVSKVLTELGAPTAEELGAIKAKGELADLISAGEKDWGKGMAIAADKLPQLAGDAKGVDIEKAKGLLPEGFELIEETVGEGEQAKKQYKIINKTIEEVAADATEDVKTKAANVLNAAKEKVAENVNLRNKNLGYQAIVDGATDGKVSQDVAKKALVTVDDNLKAAFDSIKKSLGKNRIMGGILWGAGALAAGLGIKALVDNKKNA